MSFLEHFQKFVANHTGCAYYGNVKSFHIASKVLMYKI